MKNDFDADYRIAVKIMGWEEGKDFSIKHQDDGRAYLVRHTWEDSHGPVWSPSSEIQHAFEAVKRFGFAMFQLHYDKRFGYAGKQGWSVIAEGRVLTEFCDEPETALTEALLKAIPSSGAV